MATVPSFAASALAIAPHPRGGAIADTDARFFSRLSLGLVLFIVFGFAQFSARGFVQPLRMPWEIHAHAGVMLGWLALVAAQPRLAASGNLAMHRRLGWAGAALLLAVLAFGSLAGIAAVRDGIVPPFFTPAYILSLTHVGLAAFVATVVWAIMLARRTDWHRRLMIGSTVVIMEPALGRLLPMPLLGGWGGWIAMVLQLGALGILAVYDRRTLGRVHRATRASAMIVVAAHVLIELLAVSRPMAMIAAGVAGT